MECEQEDSSSVDQGQIPEDNVDTQIASEGIENKELQESEPEPEPEIAEPLAADLEADTTDELLGQGREWDVTSGRSTPPLDPGTFGVCNTPEDPAAALPEAEVVPEVAAEDKQTPEEDKPPASEKDNVVKEEEVVTGSLTLTVETVAEDRPTVTSNEGFANPTLPTIDSSTFQPPCLDPLFHLAPAATSSPVTVDVSSDTGRDVAAIDSVVLSAKPQVTQAVSGQEVTKGPTMSEHEAAEAKRRAAGSIQRSDRLARLLQQQVAANGTDDVNGREVSPQRQRSAEAADAKMELVNGSRISGQRPSSAEVPRPPRPGSSSSLPAREEPRENGQARREGGGMPPMKSALVTGRVSSLIPSSKQMAGRGESGPQPTHEGDTSPQVVSGGGVLDTPGLRRFLGEGDTEVTGLLGDIQHAHSVGSQLRSHVEDIKQRTHIQVDEGRYNQLLQEKETLATEVLQLRQRVLEIPVVQPQSPAEPALEQEPPKEKGLHDPNGPKVLHQRIDELHQQLQELQLAHKSSVQELARAEEDIRSLSQQRENLSLQNARLTEQVNSLGDGAAAASYTDFAPVGTGSTVRDEIAALRNELHAIRDSQPHRRYEDDDFRRRRRDEDHYASSRDRSDERLGSRYEEEVSRYTNGYSRDQFETTERAERRDFTRETGSLPRHTSRPKMSQQYGGGLYNNAGVEGGDKSSFAESSRQFSVSTTALHNNYRPRDYSRGLSADKLPPSKAADLRSTDPPRPSSATKYLTSVTGDSYTTASRYTKYSSLPSEKRSKPLKPSYDDGGAAEVNPPTNGRVSPALSDRSDSTAVLLQSLPTPLTKFSPGLDDIKDSSFHEPYSTPAPHPPPPELMNRSGSSHNSAGASPYTKTAALTSAYSRRSEVIDDMIGAADTHTRFRYTDGLTEDFGGRTEIRPSSRLEPPPTAGLRTVTPKPLVTQHNKHLVDPQQGLSLSSLTLGRRPAAPRTPADVQTGDVIKFSRQGGKMSCGRVKYVGHLPGRSDTYVGLELDNDGSLEGKHDGTYEGVRYFTCKPNKGVFVQFNKVMMVWNV